MDRAIVKEEIEIEDVGWEDELTNKFSNTQWFLDYNLDKELRIILERCDQNVNFKKLSTSCSKKKKFHCPVDFCAKSFINNWSLNRHTRDVHNTTSIKCPRKNCNKYLKPRCIRDHIRSFHDRAKLQCTVDNCTLSFFSEKGLKRHQKFTHENFRFGCKNCGKKVVNLKIHELKCTGIRAFHCSLPDCEASFFSGTGLDWHKKFVHGNLRYKCDNCGHEVRNLQQHLDRCTSDGEKKFHCTVKNCNASFITKWNLSSHVSLVHSDPIHCPYHDCKKFAKPALISKHIKFFHECSEYFACKNCGKRFLNIAEHVARCMSDGVRKFPCQIDNCKKKFVLKRNLQLHVQKTHAAPVKCLHEHCDVFLKPSRMVTHLKYVHEEVGKSETP